MTVTDFSSMLYALNRAGVRTLDIMGGEPTLHRDIISFVREAAMAGFFVNVSSNGSNPGVLAQLMGIGEAVTVGISINDRRTLDELRGFIGAHKPVVKSLFCRDMDHGMVSDILSLRPKRFYFIYRDVLHPRELAEAVSFPEFVAAIEQNYPSEQAGMVYCSGFLPDNSRFPELAAVRCPAGTTKLGVLPDGSVYPCNLLFGRQEFLLGNLLTESLDRILRHETLARFRSFAGNPCTQRACRFHAECHGGCPAQSLFIGDSMTAPDPRCSVHE